MSIEIPKGFSVNDTITENSFDSRTYSKIDGQSVNMGNQTKAVDVNINSTINAVNLASEEYTEYGKIAKDAAAGAVLVSAVFAVIVGVIILFQPEAFKAMFEYFKENLHMLAVLALSIIPATLFIFFGVPVKKGKK